MRLLQPKLLVAGGLATGILAGVLGYVLFAEVGLLIAILIMQGVIVVAVAVAWRESHRIVERRSRDLRSAVAPVVGNAASAFVEAREAVSRLQRELDGVADAVQRHDDAASRRVREATRQLQVAQTAQAESLDRRMRELQEGSEADRTALARSFRQLYRQSEALAGLYARLRPTDAIPATRDWSGSPDLLLFLSGLARDLRPSLILECGSGISTAIFAYVVRGLGRGRVVALEHLPEFKERTEKLLDQHGLSDWAEVRLAPLKPLELEDETWPWYDEAAIPDEPLDLVLVDGPPSNVRSMSRYPAGPLLVPRLSTGGVIVLDDYSRREERALTDRWLERFPALVLETLPHEKGTAVLRVEGDVD